MRRGPAAAEAESRYDAEDLFTLGKLACFWKFILEPRSFARARSTKSWSPASDVVAAGRLKLTDGTYGLRFGHNTDATVKDIKITKA